MSKQPKRAIGLRRRWLISSILPVITIMVLIATLVSIALGSNYYSNARSALEAKANAGTEYFNTYAMTSYDEYYRSATLYAASFEDSGSIELQCQQLPGYGSCHRGKDHCRLRTFEVQWPRGGHHAVCHRHPESG